MKWWIIVQLWWTGWDIWFVKVRLQTMAQDLQVLNAQKAQLQLFLIQED